MARCCGVGIQSGRHATRIGRASNSQQLNSFSHRDNVDLELRQKASHMTQRGILWGPHWRQNRCSLEQSPIRQSSASSLSYRVLFKGWHHSRGWRWLGFGCCHPPTSPSLVTLCRIFQIAFLSSQAPELPSIHQGKIGLSCRGTLPECLSTSEKLVKWQPAGARFSSKTLPFKTIGLCDQNGRNVRRFAVLRVIRSSFETNCWALSLSSAGNLSVNENSLG
jgi:hypothetical protein